MQRARAGGDAGRQGFTLIELLVVLAVITLLLSMSWVVYGMAVENARGAATRTTLSELQTAIDARTRALASNNVRGFAQKFKESYRQGNNPAPNQTISESIAEIIVRKQLYKQAMPTRLEDMWGFDEVAGTADDSPLWAIWKKSYSGWTGTDAAPRPAGYRRDLENSELLYLFLTKGPYTHVNVSRITSRHIRDDNGNLMPEFVDDWGQPIRFYGWTHRLTRPGGTGTAIDQQLFSQTAHLLSTSQSPPASPSPYPFDVYNHPLNQDVDDPTGALSAAIAATGLMTSSFQIDLDVREGPMFVDMRTCPPFDDAHYHALDTLGHSLVMSSGPDGILGLYEPTEATNPERRTAEPLVYSDSTQNIDVIFDNITTRH